VPGRDTTEVHAGDLTLDKFIDAATMTAARPSAETRTVLLTGRPVSSSVTWPSNGCGGLNWSTAS
jgi:hypothetical protein